MCVLKKMTIQVALSNEVKSLKAELSKLKASDPDALPGDKHMWQEVFLALTVCNVVCYVSSIFQCYCLH